MGQICKTSLTQSFTRCFRCSDAFHLNVIQLLILRGQQEQGSSDLLPL